MTPQPLSAMIMRRRRKLGRFLQSSLLYFLSLVHARTILCKTRIQKPKNTHIHTKSVYLDAHSSYMYCYYFNFYVILFLFVFPTALWFCNHFYIIDEWTYLVFISFQLATFSLNNVHTVRFFLFITHKYLSQIVYNVLLWGWDTSRIHSNRSHNLHCYCRSTNQKKTRNEWCN